MTDLNKPVTRRSCSSYRGRKLVITLHPTWLSIRQAGRRVGYVIDYQVVYDCAAKLKAREDRAEKLAKKGKGKR